MEEKTLKERLGYSSVFKFSCKQINDYFNSIRAVGDLPSQEMIEKGQKCVQATKDGVNTKCADAFDVFMSCDGKDCLAAKQSLVDCAIENKIGELE